MVKYEIKIKQELFDKVGIKLSQYIAYTDECDSYIRINGGLYCNTEWDDNCHLTIKANACNDKGEIISISNDSERKIFSVLEYDTFSVCVYKQNGADISYIELYPHVFKKHNEVLF